MPGGEPQFDFREWFDAARAALEKNQQLLAGGEVKAQREQNLDKLTSVSVIEDAKGTRSFRRYLGVRSGKQVALILYTASNKQMFEKHQAEMTQFAASLSFSKSGLRPSEDAQSGARGSSTPAASKSPAKPRREQQPSAALPPSSSGLEGLYVGTESSWTLNIMTNTRQLNVKQLHYLFSANGHVYSGLPKGGRFQDFDFATAQRTEPKNCGYYRINGNQIQFNWPADGGKQPPASFHRYQDKVEIDKSPFYRVGTFDGLRLDGSYLLSSHTTFSGTGGLQDTVGGDHWIIFNQDGRFRAKDVFGYSASGRDNSLSQSGGTGTYRITPLVTKLRREYRKTQMSGCYYTYSKAAATCEKMLMNLKSRDWMESA